MYTNRILTKQYFMRNKSLPDTIQFSYHLSVYNKIIIFFIRHDLLQTEIKKHQKILYKIIDSLRKCNKMSRL